MPDDERGAFRPPSALVLVAPVVVSFLVQVPATIAVGHLSAAGGGWTLLRTAVAAAAALVLLGARRLPGPTVAVAAALATIYVLMPPGSGPPIIAVGFAIIGAVVAQRGWWAVASITAGWTIAVASVAVSGKPWYPAPVIAATLALALCFAIGASIRSRRQRALAYRARLDARRRAAEQEERTRMARELHDVLAHSLSQISVQSGMGLHLFDRDPERAREALTNIRGLAATGLDEVRGVLSFLRGDDSAPLSPQPVLADLPDLVAHRSGLGLEIALHDRLGPDRPDARVQATAYRIVQEALTNVVRHSAASTASVVIERADGNLAVTVCDDGTGLDGDSAGGGEDDEAGIRGMRERAALVGGALSVRAGQPRGVVVHATLPWHLEAAS